MNPFTWDDAERRAFWIGLWANVVLVVALVILRGHR